MKKTIFFLSVILLFACSGCGIDEPDEGKPISCLAQYTDSQGRSQKILANFYLFEGTNYVSIDPESRTGLLDATKIDAVTSSGVHVQNIGWCHSMGENHVSIVPIYTENNSYDRIHDGNFTIVCIPEQMGSANVYMMKTFSKKKSELISIDANFTRRDFDGEWGQWKKIPWR